MWCQSRNRRSASPLCFQRPAAFPFHHPHPAAHGTSSYPEDSRHLSLRKTFLNCLNDSPAKIFLRFRRQRASILILGSHARHTITLFSECHLYYAPISNSGSAQCSVRLTDNGVTFPSIPAYTLFVGSGGIWQIRAGLLGIIMSGTTTVPVGGDVWVIAAVGTTLFVLQNGVQLGQVTNAAYASGETALVISFASPLSGIQLSNFACGSASDGLFSISGNAGVAGATVSWTGTSAGST